MKVKVHLKFLYSLLSAIILATPAIGTNAKGAPIAIKVQNPIVPMALAMTPAQENGYYDRWIAYNSGTTSTTALSAIKDMETQLQAMTGQDFTPTTTKTTGRGIFAVLRSQVASYPVLNSTYASQLATLASKTSEAFFIASVGDGRLWIVGNSDQGLSHGIYHYLQQLGWRQLLASANWTITPQRSSINISISPTVIDSPMIQHTFFGTGGYGHGPGGGLPADPNGQFMIDWEAYKARNRWGGSVSLGGHNYTQFFIENQATVQGTNYMASQDGVPSPWNPYPWDVNINKPNFGNTSLQTLFANWVSTKFGQNLNNPSLTDDKKWAFSVEPSDGGQFGLEAESLALGSISNRVFHLANVAAQEVAADYPGVGRVSLLAYSSHAAVPTFAIEPNVYVTVAPYAFQSTGMHGDDLLEAWADKMGVSNPNKGLYDYWTLLDTAGLFSFTRLGDVGRKMRLASSLGYTSLQLESSYSGALSGLALYTASRLVWEPSLDPLAIRDEFYNLAFGPAGAPMKRMIERWGADPNAGVNYTENDLALALRDITAARSLATGDKASLARVNDYAKFVHYMSLFLQYRNAKALPVGDPVRHAAADQLLELLWRMHDSEMMHTFRVHQMITASSNWDSGDATLVADWNTANASAAGWGRVASAGAITDAEIATFLANDTTAYPLLFERPTFGTSWVAKNPSYTLDGVMAEGHDNRYAAEAVFYVKPGISTVNFQFMVNVQGNRDAAGTVVVKDPSDNIVYSVDFSNESVWNNIAVPTATSGNYTMNIYDYTGKVWRLRAERKLPFAITSPLLVMNPNIAGNPPSGYFHVPGGMTSVAMYTPGNFGGADSIKFKVYDNAGNLATRTFGTGPGLAIYSVPAGQDNKVWKITGLAAAKQGLEMFNIPKAYFLSADGAVIPTNAAPTVHAGYNRTIVSPTNNVALDGTVADDGFRSVTVTSSWTKVSGPGTVSFGAASLVDTTATFGTAGTYVLRLTANDSQPLSASADVTINYLSTAANVAPTVNAGPDRTVAIPSNSVAIDATVTDDGKPSATVNYKWTKVDGPGTVWFSNENAVDTTAFFDAPGDYILRLTATDTAPLAGYDALKVTVAPDYHASPNKIGDTITVGNDKLWDWGGIGQTFNNIANKYSARFRALENSTVDRVMLRFSSAGLATSKFVIGIQTDDGKGNPSGTFLASTNSTTGVTATAGVAWYQFTQGTTPLTLTDGQVYHVVVQLVSGPGASTVHRSTTSYAIRPYDRAYDPMMTAMAYTSPSNKWTAVNADPFFALGNGSNAPIAGPGQAVKLRQDSLLVSTGGGTGGIGSSLAGQKFKIYPNTDLPPGSRIAVTKFRAKINSAGGPTSNLIVKLRKADGTELARATATPGDAAANEEREYAWTDAAGADKPVGLIPGDTYLITTEFAGGSLPGHSYKFAVTWPDTGMGTGSWGGISDAVSIKSTTQWASNVVYSNEFDMWFGMDGKIKQYDPLWTNGQAATLGNWRLFNYSGVGQLFNSLDDEYAAVFKPRENITVDRVFQRLSGVDAGTMIEVGIMADDGTGKPDGRYIVSTGSYDPANGDSVAWATFTQAVTLEAMKTYHIVTRPTALGAGEQFNIYRSTTNENVRPSDLQKDEQLGMAYKKNGGLWTTQAFDPYFALANGSTVISEVGQPWQGSANHLITTGGTGGASFAQGQRFKVNVGEIPAGHIVRAGSMSFQINKSSSPTDSLIIDIREVQPGGTNVIVGTITVPPALADNTQRTFNFDGGVLVDFVPGRTYLITPRFGGSGGRGSQNYSMLNTYAATDQAAATWGGTTDAVAIQSGTGNNWSSYSDYTARNWADLWFKINGTVMPGAGAAGGT